MDKNAASCPDCGKTYSHDTNEERGLMPPPPPLTPPPYRSQGMPSPNQPLGGFDIKKFLSFETMITPMIIKVIYVAGSVIIVLIALIAMFGGIAGGSFGAFFGGIFGGAVGLVAYRVYLEILILLFNIYRELKEVNKNTK